MIYKNIFKESQKWFDQYVEGFYQNEEDRKEIDLKYQHSYRVYKNIKKLAIDIQLSETQIIIAEVIGLFHDLGRFEQFKTYKTFSDKESLDHAQLSVKILKENNLLYKLNKKMQDYIYFAIQNHNKLALPEDINEEKLLFSRLIRDADKLDIWGIFAERYHSEQDNKKINLELSNKGITPKIYQNVLEGKPVKYSSLRTVDDFKLIQLGWTYDINFTESLKLLKERQYLEKIYNSMEKSRKVKKIYNKLNEYISNKIKF